MTCKLFSFLFNIFKALFHFLVLITFVFPFLFIYFKSDKLCTRIYKPFHVLWGTLQITTLLEAVSLNE